MTLLRAHQAGADRQHRILRNADLGADRRPIAGHLRLGDPIGQQHDRCGRAGLFGIPTTLGAGKGDDRLGQVSASDHGGFDAHPVHPGCRDVNDMQRRHRGHSDQSRGDPADEVRVLEMGMHDVDALITQ